ncbi:hypothetical protein [Stappia sp.]|uniref:hypothetical protein n=1 Tax=Stappia sp. TaxID=1870903 RepID=UPI003D0E0A55
MVDLVDSGNVSVPISAPILSEVLQPASGVYFEDRIMRARMLNSLSRGACLPYISDLLSGINLDGEQGWMPVSSLNKFSFSNFVETMRVKIRHHERLSRAHRRRLSSPKVFRDEVLRNPYILAGFDDPWKEVPFLREFIDGDYWRGFLKGDISIDDADAALRRWLVDFEALFRIFHNLEEERDVLQRIFADNERRVVDAISGMQSCMVEMREAEKVVKEKKSELRKGLKEVGFDDRFVRGFLSKLSASGGSKEFTADSIFGNSRGELQDLGVYEIFSAYINASLSGRSVSSSDYRDVFHALYLGSVDAWRGDRSFSNILISRKVRGWEKIKPSIQDLYDFLLEKFG